VTDADRHLVFRGGGRRLALATTQIEEIAPDRALMPVALAPSDVAGITVARGRLLTVVELATSPGSSDDTTDACLIILAAPWSHLALRVTSDVSLEDQPKAVETLDIDALSRRIETAIRDRGD